MRPWEWSWFRRVAAEERRERLLPDENEEGEHGERPRNVPEWARVWREDLEGLQTGKSRRIGPGTVVPVVVEKWNSSLGSRQIECTESSLGSFI